MYECPLQWWIKSDCEYADDWDVIQGVIHKCPLLLKTECTYEKEGAPK